MSFDGARLRLINAVTSRVAHSVDYGHKNAFTCSHYAETDIKHYESLFFLAANQTRVVAYNSRLSHIQQLNLHAGVAIIALHWHRGRRRLSLAGTNGWIKCFALTTTRTVTRACRSFSGAGRPWTG